MQGLIDRAFILTCAILGTVSCGRPSSVVRDLDGAQIDPLAGDAPLTVLAFVSTECPISNRYAPELLRTERAFSARGVRFWLVYPNRRDSASKIRRHVLEFGYDLRALLDSDHGLARLAGVKVTPEVAVFRHDRSVLYAGRIDDRYVSFGSARPEPRRRDLWEALEAGLAGHAVQPARSAGVGCAIDD